MKKLTWFVILLLAVSLGMYSIVQFGFIGADKAGLIENKVKNIGKLSEVWYIFLYIHLIFGTFPLVVGPFLFSEKLRKRNLQIHKKLGMYYFICIFISGLSGLYLARYATGGWISGLGFGCLSIVWMITAYIAIKKIKNKDMAAHREWMIRNYALTFAGVTLRLWLPIFITLFGFDNFDNSYRVIAWLAWIPNLILAELYIKRTSLTIQGNTVFRR